MVFGCGWIKHSSRSQSEWKMSITPSNFIVNWGLWLPGRVPFRRIVCCVGRSCRGKTHLTVGVPDQTTPFRKASLYYANLYFYHHHHHHNHHRQRNNYCKHFSLLFLLLFWLYIFPLSVTLFILFVVCSNYEISFCE